MVQLEFRAGTLEIQGLPPDAVSLPAACAWDPRAACHRAPASAYADVVRTLVRGGISYEDQARAYQQLQRPMMVRREPRPYQREALAAWQKAGGRGVVVLPTGAGKTLVAQLAIEDRRRSTLVVAPTLDLVRQWYDGLRATFGEPVGLLGGGDHDVQSITVTTYDSAYLHMEHLGARFGLVVFDECHHLPGPTYALAARLCLAPYRLGLTATPERADGREADLAGAGRADRLPQGHRRARRRLPGGVRDRAGQRRPHRGGAGRVRRRARRSTGTSCAPRASTCPGPAAGRTSSCRAARTDEGRRALAAYRRQREIAFTAPAKLDYVERLLEQHRDDRALIFTEDNATVYLVSRRFLVPAITHKTKVRERSDILAGLAERALRAPSRPRGCSTRAWTSPRPTWRWSCRAAARCGSTCSGWAASCASARASGRCSTSWWPSGTAEAQTSERRRDHVAYR